MKAWMLYPAVVLATLVVLYIYGHWHIYFPQEGRVTHYLDASSQSCEDYLAAEKERGAGLKVWAAQKMYEMHPELGQGLTWEEYGVLVAEEEAK